MVQPLWNTVCRLIEKLKIELSYDPEIPLLSIYPKGLEIGSQRNICTPMFIAALVTVAKTQKQPSVYQLTNG